MGVMGMSLGGYSTTLVSTLEDDLSFVVPIIPLSSIADFARDQGRLGPPDIASELYVAIERANRVVSPFTRPPKIVPERTLVLGANNDQITPIHQATRIAAHLRAPLVRVDGGHLVQIGMGKGWRELGALLRKLKITELPCVYVSRRSLVIPKITSGSLDSRNSSRSPSAASMT